MPILASIQPTYARRAVEMMLGALTAPDADPIFDAADIKLFTAGPLPITPNSVTADFTEADFNGYVAVGMGLSNSLNLPSGEGLGRLGSANFLFTLGVVTNTIQGYYVENGDGELRMAEYFESPVPMNAPGDFIELDLVAPAAFSVPITV